MTAKYFVRWHIMRTKLNEKSLKNPQLSYNSKLTILITKNRQILIFNNFLLKHQLYKTSNR